MKCRLLVKSLRSLADSLHRLLVRRPSFPLRTLRSFWLSNGHDVAVKIKLTSDAWLYVLSVNSYLHRVVANELRAHVVYGKRGTHAQRCKHGRRDYRR